MAKIAINYARHIDSNIVVFLYTEGHHTLLAQHVSQYAFHRVPAREALGAFEGNIVGEFPDGYERRRAAHLEYVRAAVAAHADTLAPGMRKPYLALPLPEQYRIANR